MSTFSSRRQDGHIIRQILGQRTEVPRELADCSVCNKQLEFYSASNCNCGSRRYCSDGCRQRDFELHKRECIPCIPYLPISSKNGIPKG